MDNQTARRVEVLSSQLVEAPEAQGLAVDGEFHTAGHSSLWDDVKMGPPDAILGISDAFKKDTDPKKLNLGVGAYAQRKESPMCLKASRKQSKRFSKTLLRIRSTWESPAFRNSMRCRQNSLLERTARPERGALCHSAGSPAVQAPLRVGGEFLQYHYPGPKIIYVPTPTWPNHHKIFALTGFEVRTYRYFKPETRGLDYEGLLEDLKAAPQGAVVLLHSCAHNPTGVDPSKDQWKGILELVQTKKLLPFFDSAYQGFATGDLEGDAASIRLFAEAGLEMLLAQSYAKNMGLYGERVGALSVVSSNPENVQRVESQLKQVIRPMFSNPPRHGASIVVKVLSDPALYAEWREELSGMANRIKDMRQKLYDALLEVGAPGDWKHIINQIGMFSYTGLTKAQVENMTNKWHVYMTFDGRISMAGLSGDKCRYMAEAIKDSVENA
eukprot:jgi/Botrbrau1/15557/Bobra.0274s0001.1